MNFKSFSPSLEQFFLTVGQNNFGNKIPEHVFIAFFQVVPQAGGNVIVKTNVFLTLGVVMDNIRIALMNLMSNFVESKKEQV